MARHRYVAHRPAERRPWAARCLACAAARRVLATVSWAYQWALCAWVCMVLRLLWLLPHLARRQVCLRCFRVLASAGAPPSADLCLPLCARQHEALLAVVVAADHVHDRAALGQRGAVRLGERMV